MLGEGMRRRRGGRTPEPKPERPERPAGPRLRWGRWLLGGALGVAAAFGIGYLIATAVLFPRPALAGDEITVPDLGGMTLDDARGALASAQLHLGATTSLANPTAPRGDVVAQDPLAGQRLRPGASVDVGVSTGPATVMVPDLAGLPFETASELAERIGFTVERRDELSQEPGGSVLRTEPGPGADEQAGAPLVLIVSEAPPVPDSLSLPGMAGDSFGPTPLAPDTARVQADSVYRF